MATVRSKAQLQALQVLAYPGDIENQRSLEGQLVADIIDTLMADEVIKTGNYNVLIGDIGKTFSSALDGMIFTLLAGAIGHTFTFANIAEDGDAKLSISPNASDGIVYAGAADNNKDLINTKTSAKKGDFVTLASLESTAVWYVTAARGIWAKEA